MSQARKVRIKRIEKGLTQAELATKAGVSRKTIVRLENGETVNDTTKYHVAKALGFDPKEFFSEHKVSA